LEAAVPDSSATSAVAVANLLVAAD